MAYALRVIGPVSRSNLRIIRLVRNAPAHAKIPIAFDTPEVAAMCADLKMVDPMEQGIDMAPQQVGLLPRSLFAIVCNHTSFLLYKYSLGPLIPFTSDSLKPETGSFPAYDLYLQRKPLP
jgi:hypothetical protein